MKVGRRRKGRRRKRKKVQEWILVLLSLGLGTCIWQFCSKKENFGGAKPVSVLHPWSLEHMELQRESHSLGEECTSALYFHVSYGLVCEGSWPSMSEGPVSLARIFFLTESVLNISSFPLKQSSTMAPYTTFTCIRDCQ